MIPRSDDADRLPAAFAPWLTTLEARHLADLRVPEVTRALRALSSAYVERRHKVTEGATLDSAGKRAAFALYYAPLHFLTVSRALRALDAAVPPAIVDLGCGTGAAGAAWGVLDESRPRVLGIDRHPWAAAEAARTYRHFGLQATTKVTDAVRLPRLTGRTGVVAAYLLNELQGDARERLVTALLNAAAAGHAVLVVEPIARPITPWWDEVAARATTAGWRADEWRWPAHLPAPVERFARAAGLRHDTVTARTLWIGLR